MHPGDWIPTRFRYMIFENHTKSRFWHLTGGKGGILVDPPVFHGSVRKNGGRNQKSVSNIFYKRIKSL